MIIYENYEYYIILIFNYLKKKKKDSLSEKDYKKCIDTVFIKNGVDKYNNIIPQDNFMKEIYKCRYYHFSVHDEYKTG